MKRIFKYTFLQRKQTILLNCAIMACISGVELLFLTLTQDVTNGFYHLWFGLTMVALAVIPISLFVKCSSGYARSLLFTDESYLMLTLPVRTEEMLLGRMLCGLIELGICSIISLLLLILVLPSWIIYYMGYETQDFFRLAVNIPATVLAKNIPGILVLLLMLIAGFILIGNVTLAVHTILRSFNIKRMRTLWTVGGILLFMSILSVIGTMETRATAVLGDYCSIPIHGISYLPGQRVIYSSTTIHIPVISILLAIGLGIGCFFVSAWLLKKKVEV